MRKKCRLSQSELGEAVGYSRFTVLEWEAGRLAPDSNTLSKIAGVLCTTTSYLLGETDSPQPIENGENNALSLHGNDIIRIRVFSAETAASFDDTTVFDDVVVDGEGTINFVYVNKKYFTTSSCNRLQDLYSISLWDDSMQGAQMAKGQIAIVERTSQVRSGEVMFVYYNGHTFFRWVISKQDGTVELRPANPNFRSEFITPGEEGVFAIKGVVLGVLNAPYAPQKAF